MNVTSVPAAEMPVSPKLVRGLLTDQHPDLAGLGIEVLANGWDNMVCRLGDDYVVRLPRRTGTWARARGWALALALVFLTHSADNPLMAGIGRRALDAVLDEDRVAR